MTPVVEINIPAAGKVDRRINGCLCMGLGAGVVLAHRGNGFTVTPGRIPKATVHGHFQTWLQPLEDGDGETEIIPVGAVDSTLVTHLAAFVDMVRDLKATWAGRRGRPAEVGGEVHWREELNFPAEILRASAVTAERFGYRHGPIQFALKKKLTEILPPCCRPALNTHVDLAILHENVSLALFEVKTDLGHQVFSGIGQLLCYRHWMARPTTAIFLVLPGDVLAQDPDAQLGPVLRDLGIALLRVEGRVISSWDGESLDDIVKRLHQAS